MFLSSNRVMMKPSVVIEQKQPLSPMRISILRGVAFLLAVTHWDTGVSGIHADFSSDGCSMQLDDHFQNKSVRGMIEGKTIVQ